MFYFARSMNIIFNSLLAQLVKYDVHTTRKIKSIHALFYHTSLFYTKFHQNHLSCTDDDDNDDDKR